MARYDWRCGECTHNRCGGKDREEVLAIHIASTNNCLIIIVVIDQQIDSILLQQKNRSDTTRLARIRKILLEYEAHIQKRKKGHERLL